MKSKPFISESLTHVIFAIKPANLNQTPAKFISKAAKEFIANKFINQGQGEQDRHRKECKSPRSGGDHAREMPIPSG